MRFLKPLLSAISPACVGACAGLFVLTLLANTAYAIPVPSTPEIDPGSLSSAITLLTGSALILTGRRLRK